MEQKRRENQEKIALFRGRFVGGLTHVYGSYDPSSGRTFQVKRAITDDTIYQHLKGIAPLGLYLLVGSRTRMVVIDFDREDANPPLEFVAHAKHYDIPSYIEISKSKGYHVHVFFSEQVMASKARLVIRHILAEIGQSGTEVFPKQDALDTRVTSGNFINLPLFGRWVAQGRTVFVDEKGSLVPYPDQWNFLEGIETIGESRLDDVIEMNDLQWPPVGGGRPAASGNEPGNNNHAIRMGYSLPPCAQRMLNEGVTFNQRVAAFRLAIQLRKAGLGEDLALAVLETWAPRNRPADGKNIITVKEIKEQVHYAFTRTDLRGCGCHDETINTFCETYCPLYLKSHANPAA